MPTTVTEEQVLRLAKLAHLHLDEDEVKSYVNDLSAIVEYFQILDTTNTSGLKPTTQVTGLVNVMRPDEVQVQRVNSDNLLSIVPHTQERYIKVKRMI